MPTPTPIILIHGALGAAAQLETVHDALGGAWSRYMIELEGHGNTPPSAAAYDVERFAMSVREFADRLGIERAHLFGYSMGGYVALHLAARCPERVASVATLGTKLAWTPDVATRETSRLDPAVIRAKVPKFAELLERRHAGAGGWELVLAKTAALMTSLGAHPIVDAAARKAIRPPVRIMVGDRDAIVTIDESVAAAHDFPRGECAVLPNAPHPIDQVRSPLLAEVLRDFFASIPE